MAEIKKPRLLLAGIKCPRCRKKFPTIRGLNVHYAKAHDPDAHFVYRKDRIIAFGGKRNRKKLRVKPVS